ncbi:MAG: 50S ribosomal protein L4 [Patescibacteria group bacterium]
MKLPVYNLAGQQIEEIELDASIFDVPAKTSVLHQVVVAHDHNARQVLAHTKVKSEVRGGGKKPWKQKGTGRARAGSTRSPLWRGGGVTFGPRKERNFAVKVNKKMKNLALRMVLSDKARDQAIIVVDKLELPELKTKHLAALLAKLPVKSSKAVLALAKGDQAMTVAAKNLPKVFACGAASLNVVDLLKHQYLLVSKAGLAMIEQTYRPKTVTIA